MTPTLGELAARCATRTSGSPTCAPSAPPTGSASLRLAELRRAARAEAAARRDGRDPRLRRAPHPRRARRAPRRQPTAPRTCSRTTRAATSATSPAARGDDRRRLARRSTSPAPTAQVEGNLNCPLSVTKSAAFFAVRVADRPRRAALRRRLPPDRGHRPAGLPAQRPRRRPPSPPATSRPRAASPTSSSPRSPAPARSRPRDRGR